MRKTPAHARVLLAAAMAGRVGDGRLPGHGPGRGRTRCAFALLGTLALVPRAAHACGACRGAGGAGGALTAPDERWNVSGSVTGRAEIGSWDSSGRAHGEPAGVRADDLVGQLAVGVRVLRPLELGLFAGGGGAWFAAPGLVGSGAGFTDVVARARLDLAAEDPSQPSRFASATWFSVRAPTGAVPDATQGGTAGLIGAFGLGAWEFAAGADLRRTFGEHWQPFVAVEASLRAPDQSPGFARALGPRATARAGVTYFFDDVFAVSALAEWSVESDIALSGQRVPDSWQQRTSIGLAGSVRGPAGLRLAVSIASDLPLDGIGRNAEATTRLGFTVGWSGIERAWRACPMNAPRTVARAAGGHDG